MKSILLLMVTAPLLVTSVSYAGAPPANTIPIVADRPNFNTVDLELFLQLSWHYFDVLQAGDQYANKYMISFSLQRMKPECFYASLHFLFKNGDTIQDGGQLASHGTLFQTLPLMEDQSGTESHLTRQHISKILFWNTSQPRSSKTPLKRMFR